ncbi:hypothetical protein E4H04_08110 [Candidatus Bathyarchaeota archaeon]|nr:MAG: hypothetical protein E4H04_08110 [Candidatus Bathyarchaeota archaeon]
MMRGRPRKTVTLNDLPQTFRKALIQFMADRQIDNLEDGLERAGITLLNKTKEIKKLIDSEAEHRYKKRHMTELNKTLATRDKTAYAQKFWEAKNIYCITYPCKVCGKPIEITVNSTEIQHIRNYLYKEGWGHFECIQ